MQKGEIMSCPGGDHSFKLAGVYKHRRRSDRTHDYCIDLYDKFYCVRCLQSRYRLNFSSVCSDDVVKFGRYPPVSDFVLSAAMENERQESGEVMSEAAV